MLKYLRITDCLSLVGISVIVPHFAFHLKIFLLDLFFQLTAVPIGLEHLNMPSEEAQKKSAELANRVPPAEEGRRKWRRGEMEFEALMRHLDNAVSLPF